MSSSRQGRRNPILHALGLLKWNGQAVQQLLFSQVGGQGQSSSSPTYVICCLSTCRKLTPLLACTTSTSQLSHHPCACGGCLMTRGGTDRHPMQCGAVRVSMRAADANRAESNAWTMCQHPKFGIQVAAQA